MIVLVVVGLKLGIVGGEFVDFLKVLVASENVLAQHLVFLLIIPQLIFQKTIRFGHAMKILLHGLVVFLTILLWLLLVVLKILRVMIFLQILTHLIRDSRLD